MNFSIRTLTTFNCNPSVSNFLKVLRLYTVKYIWVHFVCVLLGFYNILKSYLLCCRKPLHFTTVHKEFICFLTLEKSSLKVAACFSNFPYQYWKSVLLHKMQWCIFASYLFQEVRTKWKYVSTTGCLTLKLLWVH